MIERWFEGVLTAEEHAQAMAIAALGGMVKGYGDTRYRTTSRLMTILDYLDTTPDVDPAKITALHSAAMAPDSSFESVDEVVAAPAA
jgi:indolepyruvate ferredoxin oxidoreductase beta subunit